MWEVSAQDLSDIDPDLLAAYYGDHLKWLRAVCRLSILSRVRVARHKS